MEYISYVRGPLAGFCKLQSGDAAVSVCEEIVEDVRLRFPWCGRFVFQKDFHVWGIVAFLVSEQVSTHKSIKKVF